MNQSHLEFLQRLWNLRGKKRKDTSLNIIYPGPNKCCEVQLEGTDDICTTLRNTPRTDRKGHSSYLWPGQLAKIHEPEQTACPKSANYTCASCYTGLVLDVLGLVASNEQIRISEHVSSESFFLSSLSPVSRKPASCVVVQGR